MNVTCTICGRSKDYDSCFYHRNGKPYGRICKLCKIAQVRSRQRLLYLELLTRRRKQRKRQEP